MGQNSNFADFSASARKSIKRFFRNVWEYTVIAFKVIGLFAAVVLGLVIFITLNAFAFATAMLWMPLTYWRNPEWLAKKIAQGLPDEPWEFFFEGRYLAVLAFGWFWKWLGTRTWAPRKQRYAFISRFGNGIANYPVKTQIEFWEDCDFQSNNFRCMSEEARIELLKKLLGTNKTETIIAMMKSYDKTDKGRTVQSLLGAIRDCDHHAYERKQVVAIILTFKFDAYDLSMLSNEEWEELWQLPSKDVKLLVCNLRGMSLNYFSRLILEKDTALGDGLKVLRAYWANHTFSSRCISYLIGAAPKRPEIIAFFKDVIIRDGLSQDMLQEVWATKISTFISEVEEVVAMHADLEMIRGIASINLSPAEQKAENASRWASYCAQRQISELAQMRMSQEQYIAFKHAGQKLTPSVLEYMLVNVSESEFLALLLREEYEQLTPKMRTLISTIASKQRILVDVTAEKMAEEPIEL